MVRKIFTLKKSVLMLGIVLVLASCHRTTLEDQAEKMAEDYTERYCPTPVTDMQRTDSITFDRDTHTLNYFFTLTDKADNADNVAKVKKKITNALLAELKENTNMRVYKDAGYKFHYTFRSESTKSTLYEVTFSQKNYR